MGFWGNLGKVLSIAGPVAAAPFTGGASLLGTLGGLGTGASAALGAGLGAAGSALGAISQGQASNRGNKYEGQLALQDLLMQRDQQAFQNNLAREQFGQQSASDAWKKLLSAQHTLSPAAMPNITPYATPQRQATDAERAGAEALSAEVMKRLQGGNPITPFAQSPMNVDPKLLNSGVLERILGYASPGLSYLGNASLLNRLLAGAQPRGGDNLNV